MNQNSVAFLQGREYERRLRQKTFTKKQTVRVFKELVKKFPNYRKPDDGNGDEASYNSGFNEAIDELSKIVLDEIINLKSEKI